MTRRPRATPVHWTWNRPGHRYGRDDDAGPGHTWPGMACHVMSIMAMAVAGERRPGRGSGRPATLAVVSADEVVLPVERGCRMSWHCAGGATRGGRVAVEWQRSSVERMTSGGWEQRQRASASEDVDAAQTDVHRREEIRYTHPSRCLPEEDWSSRRRARDRAVSTPTPITTAEPPPLPTGTPNPFYHHPPQRNTRLT